MHSITMCTSYVTFYLPTQTCTSIVPSRDYLTITTAIAIITSAPWDSETYISRICVRELCHSRFRWCIVVCSALEYSYSYSNSHSYYCCHRWLEVPVRSTRACGNVRPGQVWNVTTECHDWAPHSCHAQANPHVCKCNVTAEYVSTSSDM